MKATSWNLCLALLVGAAVLCMTACGGDEDAAPPEVDPFTSDNPLACLKHAGLTDLERRNTDLWYGNKGDPFAPVGLYYRVGVEKASSAADARGLERDALGRYQAWAGKFLVTGACKCDLRGEEAEEADRIVKQVAACLSG